MTPDLRITLIVRDRGLADQLELRLQSKGYQVVTLANMAIVMGLVYSDPPNLIVVDLSGTDPDIQSIIRSLKQDSYFGTVPIIGLLDETLAKNFDWQAYPLDDFVFLPVSFPELFTRIDLSIQRIQRVFDNNPLTRLPGNTSIQQAIEKALNSSMAVCYIDINHFKPYNDVYGFSHGDEVLRMLARIMFNAVKDSGGGFTGHIGGDDFVFIVPQERAEYVCKTIIDHFATIILDLFDDQEKSRGYYIGVNRKGQMEQIPLLSISIAVVMTGLPHIQHYGKVAEVAAELKKLAKRHAGSCYLIDKRRA